MEQIITNQSISDSEKIEIPPCTFLDFTPKTGYNMQS